MADPFEWGAEPSVAAADGSLIAVYKPPRMHTAPGASGGSLCTWLFERFPDAASAGRSGGRAAGEGGLLHRLDYETSGLVLFARTQAAFERLLADQEQGRFRKEYLLRASCTEFPGLQGSRPARALPLGVPACEWEAALAGRELASLAAILGGNPGARIESSFRRYGPGAARVACIGEGGRGKAAQVAAKTYATLFLGAEASEERLELSVALDLGFRHQIRAHLAWIGLPILGDPLYRGDPAPWLRLLAFRLRFTHPATGEAETISLCRA